MLDPIVDEFLEDRIRRRVESKKKDYINSEGELDDIAKMKVEQEAREEYTLENWLKFCGRNSDGVSVTTHPCKFSHPDASTSPVYVLSRGVNNGYVCSENRPVESDDDVIFSTAAYMPIYTFLKLKLSDDRELIDHLNECDSSINQQFKLVENYEVIRKNLLSVRGGREANETSGRVKQVYFPVKLEYHLLSVLSSSVIMFDLKSKVKEINSYEINEAAIKAKKDGEYSSSVFKEVLNVTVQGHVKSNSQCVSQLNKNNFGESFLLMSVPPKLEKRTVHFPKTNFFVESFYYKRVGDIFYALHKLMKSHIKDMDIREERDYLIQQLIERIVEQLWVVRSVSETQYYEASSKLSQYQKIWLCSEYEEQREQEDQWLGKLSQEISHWVIRTYEKLLGKNAIKLGREEWLKLIALTEKNKEMLR